MQTEGRNNFMHYTTMIRAKNDATISGDALTVKLFENICILAIADGLGSGTEANASATVVIKELEGNPELELSELLRRSDLKMLGLRGAVAAIMRVCFQRNHIQFASIGNISCYIFRPSEGKVIYPRQMRGYLSGRTQHFVVQALEYKKGDFFLLHTDGIEITDIRSLLLENEFIKLQQVQSSYLTLKNDDASLIAARLF